MKSLFSRQIDTADMRRRGIGQRRRSRRGNDRRSPRGQTLLYFSARAAGLQSPAVPQEQREPGAPEFVVLRWPGHDALQSHVAGHQGQETRDCRQAVEGGRGTAYQGVFEAGTEVGPATV